MQSSTGPMSFFVTSVGSGKGADLGVGVSPAPTRIASRLPNRPARVERPGGPT
jgi:hypothetical protein